MTVTLAALVDLPSEAIPTEAVLVLGFIDPNGDPAFRIATGGDDAGTISTLIGLLTLAQHHLMTDANPPACGCHDEENP